MNVDSANMNDMDMDMDMYFEKPNVVYCDTFLVFLCFYLRSCNAKLPFTWQGRQPGGTREPRPQPWQRASPPRWQQRWKDAGPQRGWRGWSRVRQNSIQRVNETTFVR